MRAKIQKHLDEHSALLAEVQKDEKLLQAIENSARAAGEVLKSKGHILFCGNGGSAADAQHIAAELSVRLEKDRMPLAGISLTTNSSVLTAAGNDYSFNHIFSRQVAAHGRSGDMLVALSTSGNSSNIIKAIEAAKNADMIVFGLTGSGGGAMADMCDFLVAIPSRRTMRVQEMHCLLLHAWCELTEQIAVSQH